MKQRTLISFLLCIVLSFAMCSCGAKEAQVEYASQEAFLDDMAEGISLRLEYVDDHDDEERTDDEMAEYYLTLVAFELDRIEKYETQEFENDLFNDLAHAYIDACQMQRIMAQNYRNPGLEELWSASSIRSAIITELYRHHGLPLTSEQAADYAPEESGNVQYTASMDGELDVSTGLTMYKDDMKTYDPILIRKASGQTLFANGEITITLRSLELESGSYVVNMTMINDMASDGVTCYIGGASIDDHQISMYHPWGYSWAKAGKIGDTYSHISVSDLKEIGKEDFQLVSAYLYVITSDGSTGQYIAKIPLTIERDGFDS